MSKNCTNCFNGCDEITPDKCVKYTGPNFALLDIKNGDSLYSIEEKIFQFLETLKNGSSIIPTIDPSIICESIQSNLSPNTGEISLNNIVSAIIKTLCTTVGNISSIQTILNTLNGNYNTACIGGSANDGSGTHVVLQTSINVLCSLMDAFSNLEQSLPSTYVALSNINEYISNYLQNNVNTNYNARMVPYSPIPYVGTLDNFDITGKGSGIFDKVYLCNGQNGTPDLRGRVLVGTTTMGNTAFNPAVDPSLPGNPTYALNSEYGSNTKTLSVSEMPAHSHTITSGVVDSGHSHLVVSPGGPQGGGTLNGSTYLAQERDAGTSYSFNYGLRGRTSIPSAGKSSPSQSGITVNSTAQSTGGGSGFQIIQPVRAVHYIIYIP